MRVHLNTIGCRLNEAELETWSRDFLALGHQITGDPGDADLVVVNTCAVTGEAVRKSRKLMHRAHRRNPRAKLVVSGCYASLEPSQTTAIPGVDLVIDNRDKEQLVAIAQERLDLHAMPQLATEPGANPLLARGRQRAFIKVQDGCRYQCTFCIVTVARGEERSRPIPEILEQINRLHGEGIQEAVLTGVHIGGYGSDCNSDLFELVERVLAETDIPRLRLGAVEPWDLPERFWSLFRNPRFMPHLHLPLQSGSDSVLKRMARRCKRDEFAGLVETARREVPDFNVTTDVMVGFPGESDDEWRQTLELVERIGFGHLHIFPFSPRQGTLAAQMEGALEPAVIKQRSRELHGLGERLKQATLERYLQRTLPVLVEGSAAETGTCHGYTPNYLRVALEDSADKDLEGRVVPVHTLGLTPEKDALRAVVTET
jgi:threonylcarbamoyladenosine tRNA methylthiotransferase MtaB